jgi:hypothetical protein
MSFIRRLARGLTGSQPMVCVGHSHTENVAAAAAAAGIPLTCINFWRFPGAIVRTADAVELAPAIRSQLRAPIFSFIGGAVHHDIGLFAHPRPYDFVLPERQDLPFVEGAEIISYDAICAAMLPVIRPYFEMMAATRAVIQGPMFQMEAPPIYRDEMVPDKPDWIAFYGDRPVSPAWLRHKLWRVHSEFVRNFCQEADILFVPHPSEAINAQGFLSAEFHGSFAHANQAYGALVLRQMQNLLDDGSTAQRSRAGSNG